MSAREMMRVVKGVNDSHLDVEVLAPWVGSRWVLPVHLGDDCRRRALAHEAHFCLQQLRFVETDEQPEKLCRLGWDQSALHQESKGVECVILRHPVGTFLRFQLAVFGHKRPWNAYACPRHDRGWHGDEIVVVFIV
eukprot:3434172-Rhodomonas_salina.3